MRRHEHTIAMLSENVGLSARRFTRLFTLEVGLTPKLYARIKRFELVLAAHAPSPPSTGRPSHSIAATSISRI